MSERYNYLEAVTDDVREYDNMCGVVYASIKHHPNGREFLEFEQPCSYSECSSNYYRYEGKEV